MKQETKDRVRRVLYDFAASQQPKQERWTYDEIGQAYPFHRLLFSEEAIVSARVERSVVTSMGTHLYPSLAEAVSSDRFTEVFLEYSIEGEVNVAACNMIDEIVTELRTPKSKRETSRDPNHHEEISEIMNSRGGGYVNRSIIADLYIGDFPDGPLFVELKSPLPNLDIAAESKRKILYYLLIKEREGTHGAQGFLGLTYNPHITREGYGHSFTKRIMDMEKQVLIGSELWDMIGGSNTYNEILELIEDVYQELAVN